MEARPKITKEMYTDYGDFLHEMGASEAYFHCKWRKVKNHTKHHPDTWHVHYKSHLKKELECQ